MIDKALWVDAERIRALLAPVIDAEPGEREERISDLEEQLAEEAAKGVRERVREALEDMEKLVACLEAQLAEDTEKRVRERVREVLHNREEFFEAVQRRIAEAGTEEPPHPGPDLRDASRGLVRYELEYDSWEDELVRVKRDAGSWVRYEDTEKLVAEVAKLEARIRELTDWRPMSAIPESGPGCADEATGSFRLLDSAGNEYVASQWVEGGGWEIWDGAEFVPLALEEGVTFVGWLPTLPLAGSEGGDRG